MLDQLIYLKNKKLRENNMQWSISMRPHTFSEMYGCEPVKKYFYNNPLS